MAYSGIGGQAVIEGIMMRNQDRYAIAVRKPDGQIEVTVENIGKGQRFARIPILRGTENFLSSLLLGIRSLMKSAEYFEDEDKEQGGDRENAGSRSDGTCLRTNAPAGEKRKETAALFGTLALSLLIALALFLALPYGLSRFFARVISSSTLLALLEGVIRVAIFLVYLLFIGRTEDIHRTYMYHGAEHKCINCIENGWELNLVNVRRASCRHKRCGTSFIFLVLMISVFVFMLIRADQPLLQLLLRILLVPLIAGISYEFIRLTGRSDARWLRILSAPGLWIQGLTTQEPEDEMMEVSIASVEAVFDWKTWQRENLGTVREHSDSIHTKMEGVEAKERANDLSGGPDLGQRTIADSPGS